MLRRLGETKSVIVVEHDLALLDYLADQAHLLYGEAAAFGVISHPLPMRSAINTYLTGYLKDENVRFRTEPIRFVAHPPKPAARHNVVRRFPALEKEFPAFHLAVGAGELAKGETVGVVGPNATGKTTFVRMLAGRRDPDPGRAPVEGDRELQAPVPQGDAEREPAGNGRGARRRPDVRREAIRAGARPRPPSRGILDVAMPDLSGGELQRAAVALALARPASLYLLDEPSAYLDADERMAMARLIRRQVERQSGRRRWSSTTTSIPRSRLRRADGVPIGGHGRTGGARRRPVPDAGWDEPVAPRRRHHVPPGRGDASASDQPGGVRP